MKEFRRFHPLQSKLILNNAKNNCLDDKILVLLWGLGYLRFGSETLDYHWITPDLIIGDSKVYHLRVQIFNIQFSFVRTAPFP